MLEFFQGRGNQAGMKPRVGRKAGGARDNIVVMNIAGAG